MAVSILSGEDHLVKLSAFLHGQKAANFTKPLFEALTINRNPKN
jgi:hypothetical protein